MLNYRRLKHDIFGYFAPLVSRPLKAFSLLEMSLVLAIMGTIAGLSMPMLLEQRALQKQQKSNQNMEIVLTALGTYAAGYRHLPCPASKTSQGEPSLLCSDDRETAVVGFVPYKALGLQKKDSTDGFGHPLRYALDPRFSQKDIFEQHKSPCLFIKDEKGNSLISTDSKYDRLAVVLVGEDQAYNEAKSSFEQVNIDQSSTFIAAPFSTHEKTPFRQRVKWSTRNNLLTRYGRSPPITEKKYAWDNYLSPGFSPENTGAAPEETTSTPPQNAEQDPQQNTDESPPLDGLNENHPF